jgi:hypothetical protein
MSERFVNWRIVNRSELDEKRWRALLSKSNFPYFQELWYLDTVFPDWQIIVVGDYQSVLPIFKSRKWGLKVQLTPLFFRASEWMGEEQNVEDTLTFLNLSAHFIQFNIHTEITSSSFEKRFFQVLDLKRSYEEIYKNYSTNQRRKLKDFAKSNVLVSETDNMALLLEVFRKEKGEEFKHLKNKDFECLENLMKHAIANKQGFIKKIECNNETIAAAAFVVSNGKLLYLKGIVNDIGKKIGAMQALFDSVIQEFAQKVDFLDFGGSSNEGLATFNRKFGAVDNNYLILTRLPNNQPWKWLVKRKLKK